MFLDSQSGVDGMVAEARSGATIGLDTEFLREKTYRARLCLVQIATRKGVYLLDPVGPLDLEPLAKLIEDPEIEIVLHSGRQDLEIFFERYGVAPRNIFDVQIGAAFAGYGGSLPYGRLVGAVTKVSLAKGESYSDWCRRPLTEAQLRYAADDVRYLLVIADRLKEKLAENGRLRWVQDEMQLLEDLTLYETDAREAWRRVGGRGSLSGRQLAALKELAAWRESEAAQRDLPRGWILKDQTLIEIARRRPAALGALKEIRGFPAKEADRSGDRIIQALEAAERAPAPEAQNGPGRAAQARARTLSGLADALVRSRCDHAGIATELVATRGELEALLADAFSGDPDPVRHRLLRGWRREMAGNAVLALASGRIGIRGSDKPPYIEEIPLDGAGG